ncbi:MAG: hypothetical protein MCM46_12335 [Candidatus Manganitrophus sp. SB1]|nr:hypothetical protein [Candidatus Manganitrophus morganii]
MVDRFRVNRGGFKPLWRGAFCAGMLLLMLRPPDLHAIHFVINSNERIQREHGPLKLGMALPDFLQAVKSKEAALEIGQFEEEKRFHADPALFAPAASGVLADFFKGQLFRIEINYRPVDKESSAVEELKAQITARYGPPRINSLPGTDLFFWDDGKTRLILERDELEEGIGYSTTYLDDDLFHQASHDRVKKETDGKSSYGRK